MNRTTFPSMNKWRLAIAGTLTLVLGALTLAPTGGPVEGSPSILNECRARYVREYYSAASGWQAKSVCEPNEYAIAVSGGCPSNSTMQGTSLTSPSTGYLDRLAWIKCTGSGTADWNATCCQLTY